MSKVLRKMAQFGRALAWWSQLVLLFLAMVVVWRLMPDDSRQGATGEE
jgi:hypothetical protein